MNIVDLVKNQLGGDIVGRIASMLGIGHKDARSVVDAGIPALLAGLSGLADSPDGVRKLNSALDSVDDRMIDNLGSAPSSGGANSIIDSGSKILGALFGNNMLSSLGGALSKFTGLSGTTISSLLRLLGPVVLGVLKGQRSKLGLDASGLANMLLGQKNNIAAAMPAGLDSVLRGVPGLSAVTGAAETARAAVASTFNTDHATVNNAGYAGSTGSSTAKWAILAAVLGLAALVWWMANRKPAVTPSNAVPGVSETAANISEQVSRLNGDVTKWFTGATGVLGRITDVESAKGALPDLQAMADKLEGWSSALGALPTDRRTTLTKLIGDKWSALQTVIDKVMAIPGVSDVLRPVMDQVRSSITALRA